MCGCCDETRAVYFGGTNPSNDIIHYLTIATTGNAGDFGNLITAKQAKAAMSGSTRGVTAGADSGYEVIEYVTIQTTGNSVDFGDLTSPISAPAGLAA
jgi:hypothetical protein